MAYATGELSLQAKCHIRLTRTWQGEEHQKVVETTIGRVIFNQAIPQDLGTKPRNTLDDMFQLEIDEVVGKSSLAASSTTVTAPTASPSPRRCSTTSRRWASSSPRAAR